MHKQQKHSNLKTNAKTKNFKDLDLLCLQEASVHNGIEDSRIIAETFGPSYKHYQVVTQISKNKKQANSIIWNSNTISKTKMEMICGLW